jgi:Protein of unknown function (DUF3024)
MAALSELEVKRCEKALAGFLVRRRPPTHIRPQLDIAYRISGQSVEIFEVRPHWIHKDQKHESPVAKATYVRTRKHWRVFWMRRDLKWHRYEPHPVAKNIEEFLEIVHRDELCCFFG